MIMSPAIDSATAPSYCDGGPTRRPHSTRWINSRESILVRFVCWVVLSCNRQKARQPLLQCEHGANKSPCFSTRRSTASLSNTSRLRPLFDDRFNLLPRTGVETVGCAFARKE